MKIFETRSAIKTFYYLLSIDGELDSEEINYFHYVGLSIDPCNFIEYSGDLEKECRWVVNSAGEDKYDKISKAVDNDLTNEAAGDDQGLTPRLLVWNLFAAAFCNGVYSDPEKRLIDHVAQSTGVDESVVIEMEQMLKTLASIQNELDWVNQTDLPSSEIISVREELEKRQSIIKESAEYLIADEIDADNPYEYKPDFFDKTKASIDEKVRPVTNRIGETVRPVTDRVGKAVKPVTDKVGSAVIPVATMAKEKTGEMFGKLSMRFKRGNKNDNKEGN